MEKLTNFDELKVYVKAKSTNGDEGIQEGCFYQIIQTLQAPQGKYIAILNDDKELKALDINYFEYKDIRL